MSQQVSLLLGLHSGSSKHDDDQRSRASSSVTPVSCCRLRATLLSRVTCLLTLQTEFFSLNCTLMILALQKKTLQFEAEFEACTSVQDQIMVIILFSFFCVDYFWVRNQNCVMQAQTRVIAESRPPVNHWSQTVPFVRL